jgi:integrase
MTVEQLIIEWVAGPGKRTRKGKPKSPASYASDRARLENHVVPTIGKVSLCDLARLHVERVRDAVAGGKTARPRVRTVPRGFRHIRGGEGAATRTVAGLSTVLGYAMERGYLAHNPALGVQEQSGRMCERFLSAAEINALQIALSDHEPSHPKAVRIVRLLLLTGCRFNEIAALTWPEVDLARGITTLRASKTGMRIVYLSEAAATELAGIERIENEPYVFPAARGGRHYQGAQKVWRSIRKAAGLPDVRIHDLRHTFASTALAEGASVVVVAKLLGHTQLRTTARYAHLAADAVRDAANRVGVAVTRPTRP